LATRVDDPEMPNGFFVAIDFEAMDRELALLPIRKTGRRPRTRPPAERPAPAGVGHADQ